MSGHNNPAGLNGFAFLEFSSPEPEKLAQHFQQMGFYLAGKHRSENSDVFRQGNINFILNKTSNSQAASHAQSHGPGACAMGFQVSNAEHAYAHAIKQGATPHQPAANGDKLTLPAIKAIGGSVIYFVDDSMNYFDNNFELITRADARCCGLERIDHLTHNVHRGNMDKWANFYIELFNFREIRFFDIKGQKTGLLSRAMASPCDKIKIPLNESSDDKSQIEEFLHAYNGEGIQHMALTSPDIYQSVEDLRSNGMHFMDVPDTYYEMLGDRINWHQEDVLRLQRNKILMDGGKSADTGLLLQIFTENLLGPAFFEIIQRKGNDGFGEGNFQALFESIERDQMRRGTL